MYLAIAGDQSGGRSDSERSTRLGPSIELLAESKLFPARLSSVVRAPQPRRGDGITCGKNSKRCWG